MSSRQRRRNAVRGARKNAPRNGSCQPDPTGESSRGAPSLSAADGASLRFQAGPRPQAWRPRGMGAWATGPAENEPTGGIREVAAIRRARVRAEPERSSGRVPRVPGPTRSQGVRPPTRKFRRSPASIQSGRAGSLLGGGETACPVPAPSNSELAPRPMWVDGRWGQRFRFFFARSRRRCSPAIFAASTISSPRARAFAGSGGWYSGSGADFLALRHFTRQRLLVVVGTWVVALSPPVTAFRSRRYPLCSGDETSRHAADDSIRARASAGFTVASADETRVLGHGRRRSREPLLPSRTAGSRRHC